MEKRLARLNLLLLSLWMGGVFFMGAVVAPLLFYSLPSRQLAGNMAGLYFACLDWFGIAAAVWFFLCGLAQGRRRYGWLAVAAALLVNRLWLASMMDGIKALGPLDRLPAGSPLLWRFGMLHAASSLIFWLVFAFLLWHWWRSVSWRTEPGAGSASR